MTVFTGFNQPAASVPSIAEAAKKSDEPIVSESFLVIVRSSICKCTVTACGDLESGCRRVLPVHRCNGSHEAKLVELAAVAQKQMKRLIADVLNTREPI